MDHTQSPRWRTDGKSHLDRVHERRSVPELEVLLEEALAKLRGSGVSLPSTLPVAS